MDKLWRLEPEIGLVTNGDDSRSVVSLAAEKSVADDPPSRGPDVETSGLSHRGNEADDVARIPMSPDLDVHGNDGDAIIGYESSGAPRLDVLGDSGGPFPDADALRRSNEAETMGLQSEGVDYLIPLNDEDPGHLPFLLSSSSSSSLDSRASSAEREDDDVLEEVE
ncbi:hypothetical protein AALP_AA2G078500 [Arabis alpina]|uniref:Uncharacterized protein n=1 Tax=Arabis alpina TaxID=50452 RepID=A0A087HFZ4_ARAAL|nr:hypothetical protein AALP_AA2G078500 [Arabis alpina]